MAVADFDGNGRRDVFFANVGSQASSQLMRSLGNWYYVETPLPPATRSFAVAADLDGDGDQDLVSILGQAPQSTTVQLLLNNGSGVFTDDTANRLNAPYAWPSCATAADIDGDGDVDLIVGHRFAGSSPPVVQQNRLYRNTGGGFFTEGTQGGMPYLDDPTVALELFDVDGDQDLDLLTGNVNQLELALNDGAGHFASVTATHLPASSLAVKTLATGDVDGDGDRDLVIGITGNPVRLLVNDGVGHFADQTAARMPLWGCEYVSLLDLDDDADLDLVYAPTDQPMLALVNAGNGTFTFANHLVPAIAPAVRSVAVADLDGDGRRDMVLGTAANVWAPEPLSRNVLLHNVGSGLVDRAPASLQPAGATLPVQGMRTNDLRLLDRDGDGDLDLFLANDFQQQDRLYDNDGNGVFTDVTAATLPIEAGNTVGTALGDVDGDGRADLLLTNYDGQPRLWLGTVGGFADATASRMPAATFAGIAAALGDLDNDGDLDAVFGVNGQDRIYRNVGAGYFTDVTQTWLPPITEQTDFVHVSDFDADGDRDILAAGPTSVRLYRNGGAGIMTGELQTVPNSTFATTVGDFDGDGDLDVLRARNTGSGAMNHELRLLRNNGSGVFLESIVSTCRGGETALAAVDIDGDGDLDCVSTTRRAQQGIYFEQGGGCELFLNNGTGAFTFAMFENAYEFGRAVCVGDVDGDGDPDVLVGNKPASEYFMVTSGQTRLYSNRQRQVALSSAARLGTTVTVQTWSMPPTSSAPMLTATFVALAPASTPFALPPFGTLRLDPASALPLSAGFTTNGVFHSSLAIPPQLALVGLPLGFQALVEGRSTAGVPSLLFTNAVTEVIRP